VRRYRAFSTLHSLRKGTLFIDGGTALRGAVKKLQSPFYERQVRSENERYTNTL
jgi:hypothetical protein